mgnify:CR=1 FL=1
MKKILLPILIFLSLLSIVAMPSSFKICMSGECGFSDGACGHNTCGAENLIHHLSARAQILNGILNFQKFIIFIAVWIILFVVKLYLENKKIIIAEFRAKQKFFSLFGVKLSVYFIKLFSRGILHPQIY